LTTLQKIETGKSNKWISFTYMGNQTSRISKLFRKINKTINTNTNNKLNNILNNKIEHFNLYDSKGV